MCVEVMHSCFKKMIDEERAGFQPEVFFSLSWKEAVNCRKVTVFHSQAKEERVLKFVVAVGALLSAYQLLFCAGSIVCCRLCC